MSHYRLTITNAAGRIVQGTDFECETDADAIAFISDQVDGRPMELHAQGRLVWKHSLPKPVASPARQLARQNARRAHNSNRGGEWLGQALRSYFTWLAAASALLGVAALALD